MPSLVIRRIAVLAAPIGLGLLAAVHPLVADGLVPQPQLWLWNLIHTLQIPLAALLGIALLLLIDGLEDAEATVARIAVVPWVAAFAAFDGIAGLATGALSGYGHAHPGATETVLAIGLDLAAMPIVAAGLPLMALAFGLAAFGGAAIALHRAGVGGSGALAIGVGGVLWTFVHPLVGAPAMLLFAYGAVRAERFRMAGRPSLRRNLATATRST